MILHIKIMFIPTNTGFKPDSGHGSTINGINLLTRLKSSKNANKWQMKDKKEKCLIALLLNCAVFILQYLLMIIHLSICSRENRHIIMIILAIIYRHS